VGSPDHALNLQCVRFSQLEWNDSLELSYADAPIKTMLITTDPMIKPVPPVIIPAIARPFPPTVDGLRLIFLMATMPRIIAGIDPNNQRHRLLNMPRIRLKTAALEVTGALETCSAGVGNGGVSVIFLQSLLCATLELSTLNS